MRRYFNKIVAVSAILFFLALSLTPGIAFAKSNQRGCIPGDAYTNLSNWGTDQVVQGPLFGQYNPYSYSITQHWSATISGSATVSATGGAEADLNAVIAGVKANINVSVTFTISGSFTNSIDVVIPPHTTKYAQYGIFRQIAYGDFKHINSDCSINDYGNQESWSPWYVGWKLS